MTLRLASLEVFFSKGSGKEFPEFFEKSIDKEKIDAILNGTVRFWSDVLRRRDWGRAEPCCAIARLREAATIPIQDEKQPSGTMRLRERLGNGAGHYRPGVGGVL